VQWRRTMLRTQVALWASKADELLSICPTSEIVYIRGVQVTHLEDAKYRWWTLTRS
jgi:hypothetical protein